MNGIFSALVSSFVVVTTIVFDSATKSTICTFKSTFDTISIMCDTVIAYIDTFIARAYRFL